MGRAKINPYGLKDLMINGSKNRTFYLQAGTGDPTNNQESGAVGSRIPVTAINNTDLSNTVISEFSGKYTTSTDRTIKSIGLYNTSSGGSCLAYTQTNVALISGQSGQLRLTLNMV